MWFRQTINMKLLKSTTLLQAKWGGVWYYIESITVSKFITNDKKHSSDMETKSEIFRKK